MHIMYVAPIMLTDWKYWILGLATIDNLPELAKAIDTFLLWEWIFKQGIWLSILESVEPGMTWW